MIETIEARLAALPRARQVGQGWVASCPAHPNTAYSLAWAGGTEGLSIACDAGCDEKAIIAAIGLPVVPPIVPRKAARAHITTAESVNPPAPGLNPDHDRGTAEFALALDQKLAQMPPPPKLAELEAIDIPDVPEAEQRKLAQMMSAR